MLKKMGGGGLQFYQWNGKLLLPWRKEGNYSVIPVYSYILKNYGVTDKGYTKRSNRTKIRANKIKSGIPGSLFNLSYTMSNYTNFSSLEAVAPPY